MLNSGFKKRQIAKLKDSLEKYMFIVKIVQNNSENLLNERNRAVTNIEKVEKHLKGIVNIPNIFEEAFDEMKLSINKFKELQEIGLEFIQADTINKDAYLTDNATNAAVATAALGTTGIAVATVGPSVAMAVATTFGTASTGTAISALTGAAAANAALAWIGGGALAAGGGGVVAGQAILALAGPVGWAIAGVSLTGGAILLAYKNKKGAEKANIETIRAEQETITLEEANNKISEMHMLTSYQTIEVSERLDKLYRKDAVNYHDFSDQEKLELGALVNSARSLATSLNIIIE